MAVVDAASAEGCEDGLQQHQDEPAKPVGKHAMLGPGLCKSVPTPPGLSLRNSKKLS